MADIDILPKRAIPAAALVDSNGVASNGSLTTTQLAARGMASLCAVDGTGTSILGATLAQIARRGIQTFCPVDEFGVAQDSSTADQLRKRGISPMVLLDPGGVALTGSATMETLRKRSLGYFCPLDESGNATTMGAVILISNSTIQDISAVGTNVGVLSVVGGTGTYTFTLTNNAGGRFTVAGTNGVNLNTASAVTAGTYAVTVSATNGVTPITRTINILVTLYVPAVLTASVGIFPFTGETMTPISGYQVQAAVGAFPFAGQSATLIPPAASYVGPGEIAGWGTAYGYWGLRGYTFAKVGANCIDVTSDPNSTTSGLVTMVIGANGYLSLANLPGYSPVYVSKIYDQVGTQHLVNTPGNRPVLVTNKVGGLPAMVFGGTAALSTAANATALPQALSIGAIICSVGGAGGQFLTDGGFAFQPLIDRSSTDIGMYAGTNIREYVMVADNVFASVIGTYEGVLSSMSVNGAIAVDGTTPGANGIGASADKLTFGATAGGGAFLTGNIYEIIIKAGHVSTTNQGLLTANQRAIGTGF